MTKYRVSEELLRQFEPQQSWLSHDSYLHGVGHMTRVFILQELICQQLVKREVAVNRTATRYAAMAHDVGRVDDGIDPEHGRLSAAWMTENLADKLSPEDLDITTYITHWHVPSDSEAPVMTAELQVLKDADALDRVRLGDLNVAYLRTAEAPELISLATDLYELSNSSAGAPETFDDVLKAAKTLGLV